MKQPPHPSAIIGEDGPAELDLSVVEASARLGVPCHAQHVFHGHSGVSSNLPCASSVPVLAPRGRGWRCRPTMMSPASHSLIA